MRILVLIKTDTMGLTTIRPIFSESSHLPLLRPVKYNRDSVLSNSIFSGKFWGSLLINDAERRLRASGFGHLLVHKGLGRISKTLASKTQNWGWGYTFSEVWCLTEQQRDQERTYKDFLSLCTRKLSREQLVKDNFTKAKALFGKVQDEESTYTIEIDCRHVCYLKALEVQGISKEDIYQGKLSKESEANGVAFLFGLPSEELVSVYIKANLQLLPKFLEVARNNDIQAELQRHGHPVSHQRFIELLQQDNKESADVEGAKETKQKAQQSELASRLQSVEKATMRTTDALHKDSKLTSSALIMRDTRSLAIDTLSYATGGCCNRRSKSKRR